MATGRRKAGEFERIALSVMGLSEFIRGLVDYYYTNKIEKLNPRIENLKAKLQKVDMEPTKTIPAENGVYFYFKF